MSRCIALLDDWSRQGVRCGIVTDGPGPVFAKLDGRHYRALPPPIAAVNPIGSGDCLMAGITDAWLSRLDPEQTLRHGIACAVANALVWDAGAIDPSAVQQEAAIVIEPVGDKIRSRLAYRLVLAAQRRLLLRYQVFSAPRPGGRWVNSQGRSPWNSPYPRPRGFRPCPYHHLHHSDRDIPMIASAPRIMVCSLSQPRQIVIQPGSPS